MKTRGDSTPIKKYKTLKGEEYMPYPYGPAQNLPKAKKLKGKFGKAFYA